MCSYCYMTTLQLAQASPYSFYDEYYQGILEIVHSRCGVVGSTDIPPAVEVHTEEPTDFCASDTYTTVDGDTCDSIALAKSVSSAALFIGSETIRNCSNIKAGLSVCLPFPCDSVYSFSSSDTCTSIEQALGMKSGTLRQLNPWINGGCFGEIYLMFLVLSLLLLLLLLFSEEINFPSNIVTSLDHKVLLFSISNIL